MGFTSLALIVFGLILLIGFQEIVIIVKGSGHWPFGSHKMLISNTHIYKHIYLH